jgi:hypothetical protein
MCRRAGADAPEPGEVSPRNVPIEPIRAACGTGSRVHGRDIFEVGERKFLSVRSRLRC